MDCLELAAVHRARSALDLAMSATPTRGDRAKAFTDAAFSLLSSTRGNALQTLAEHENLTLQKAATPGHSTLDEVWASPAGSALAQNYLESVADGSLLDSLASSATIIPPGARAVMVASAAVGDVVAEGDPKPVRRLNLSIADAVPTKSCGIVVLTEELARLPGARALFEAELHRAVARAANDAVLDALIDSSTVTEPGTGDPLNDLRIGLRAAPASSAFVVATRPGQVADLATRPEAAPGFGPGGGEFRSGIHVVPVEGAPGTVVIPSSRVALWLGPLLIRPADQATVAMRDDPNSPAQQVSLWQTNSLGLLIERSWHIAQADGVVVVGGVSP